VSWQLLTSADYQDALSIFNFADLAVEPKRSQSGVVIKNQREDEDRQDRQDRNDE
jgi:hypothetical protein